MSRISISKTIGRLAALGLLLLSSLGPWFIDIHPATEEGVLRLLSGRVMDIAHALYLSLCFTGQVIVPGSG